MQWPEFRKVVQILAENLSSLFYGVPHIKLFIPNLLSKSVIESSQRDMFCMKTKWKLCISVQASLCIQILSQNDSIMYGINMIVLCVP